MAPPPSELARRAEEAERRARAEREAGERLYRGHLEAEAAEWEARQRRLRGEPEPRKLAPASPAPSVDPTVPRVCATESASKRRPRHPWQLPSLPSAATKAPRVL